MTPKKNTKRVSISAPPKRSKAAKPKSEIVHVSIDPSTGRQTHTTRGVVFKVGETRAYDLADPNAREFVDELRETRLKHGRTDTPRVFRVETETEALRRTRLEEERRLSPRGSARSPISGQVPQKAKPAPRPDRYSSL